MIRIEKHAKAFISYVDDDGSKREGFYTDVVITEKYVSFNTKQNRVSLSWDKIIKVKGEKDV